MQFTYQSQKDVRIYEVFGEVNQFFNFINLSFKQKLL